MTLKAIKDLAPFRQWEEVEKILHKRRKFLALNILNNNNIDEKEFTQTDFMKWEYQAISNILNMKKHEIEEIDPNEELANPKEVEFTP
jgi:hypothetical protein